jgi:AP-4 complex subunit beta-1
MIYQYITNYAEKNSDLVLMAINAFLIDCKSGNGKVRGLALRSLCSLNSKDAVDYTNPAVLDGLDDIDPYVKKTAIIGCIKLYRMTKKSDFKEKLYKLIYDPSPLVVINAISALNEIDEKKGGCEPSEEIVITLLNRIKDFNEWGQGTILDLTARLEPDNGDLKYDIMNLLEDRLKHASSTVLLGAVKVFLNLTKDEKVLSRDVQERLASPLITIMASAGTTENYEICYNVISHIYFVCLKGGSDFFTFDFKQFFLKYEEPSYIKFLKLDIISMIAREDNVQDIITELEEYVSDVNSEIAKKAIRAFGDIVVRLDNFNDNISIIKNFLALKSDHITSECLLVLKNIFRKYRDAIQEFEDFLTNITFESISEIEAKAAYIWIMGEFGNEIELAPYILERMIDVHKDLQSAEISLELLTSITKLFFTRAPEVKSMLGRFMKFAISENIDADLRDRATFYYKLLQTDINSAKQIICGEDNEVDEFYENSYTTKHATHDEYFRVDVLKIKTKRNEGKHKTRTKEKVDKEEDEQVEDLFDVDKEEDKEEDGDNLIDFGEEQSPAQKESSAPTYMASDNLLGNDEPLGANNDTLGGLYEESYGSSKEADDLLGLSDDKPRKKVDNDMDDLSDVFGGSAMPSKPEPQKPALSLRTVADLDPASFQQKWMSVESFPVINRTINSTSVPPIQTLLDTFSARHIF